MDSCKDCQYLYTEGTSVVCRRFPPSAHIMITPPTPPRMQPGTAHVSFYPPVTYTMWCGEFKRITLDKMIPKGNA